MRLEVTRKTDLATRALLELDASGTRMKAGELAAVLVASKGFLAQALTPLVNRGWVRSEPGPTGGYSLAVELQGISVLEVVEAIEGTTDLGRCVLEDRSCAGGGPCALHDPWARARGHLIAELSATPLSAVSERARRTATSR